jgi:hypothetical protein
VRIGHDLSTLFLAEHFVKFKFCRRLWLDFEACLKSEVMDRQSYREIMPIENDGMLSDSVWLISFR